MHWSFYIVAGLTIGSAIAAMSLRNIVHCALLLTITFAGLALLYLSVFFAITSAGEYISLFVAAVEAKESREREQDLELSSRAANQ